MALRQVSLEDKYEADQGSVFLTGTQALLLALMRQRRFDRARGMSTAGFLSGYRGSPLASVDTEAWKAARHLNAHDIHFEPGINEDLALTAVWGTQQTALDPKATVDGVFAMWYGKGAGLDRCGDALRHAHGAGASRHGGVLVVCGDDHALKSSSQAYHSEPTFIDMQMPVLSPATIQEMLDYAILGWEMSRYSGCYVGFKVLPEHVYSTTAADTGLNRIDIVRPQPLDAENDRWIRWPDPWPDVEKRLLEVKLPAALAFARANAVNRTVVRAGRPKLGIVVAGKSHGDLQQALGLAGMTFADAGRLGISVYKIGMPWPADEEGLQRFCKGHDTILVIEEKRDLIEAQIRSALFGLPGGKLPAVLGRRARSGQMQFPQTGELDALIIARALEAEIAPLLSEVQRNRLAAAVKPARTVSTGVASRAPYFCSGCPHNRSTVVPLGSRALAGVGCHFMAVSMDRNTETFTQMGGEGVPWVGTAPFTDTEHVFVNLGEGTYYHSGVLAIRAAVAANVNVTYKILFNDAIAMTGGQPVEGELSVGTIARQLRAEGVKHIRVVADDTSPYRAKHSLPDGIGVSSRDDLDRVQRELRQTRGVSALIYDQVCATEKRRRRKRGLMAQAPRRVFINERVCEGCGDCSVKSNCLSVVPVETELGRKRAIDQTNCNQDYSCTDGFCPSFVTIEGGQLRRDETLRTATINAVRQPDVPAIAESECYDILIAGVGGTGVVTIGAILGMAAHLDGKAFAIHDKLGMAQKYGGVNSHLRIADASEDLDNVKIAPAKASLLIGGDLAVSCEAAVQSMLDRDRASLVIATEQTIGGQFTRDPDLDLMAPALQQMLADTYGERAMLVPARALARDVVNDEIGSNLLLAGFAWQKGLIPLSLEAIERAIEMNGVAVDLNKQAFAAGRHLAEKPHKMDEATASVAPSRLQEQGWEAVVRHRVGLLTDYQDARYAERYRQLVEAVAKAEIAATGKAGTLAHAVAVNYAKLLAYKDEYEVARLYTDGVFREALARTFEPGGKLVFHLAPPGLARKDPATGLPRKRKFGRWIVPAFHLLARLKFLRGTPFDLFGYHHERRQERALIARYEADISAMIDHLTPETLDRAAALASLPEHIRGYGHIKQRSIVEADARRRRILDEEREPKRRPHAVAAE